MNLAPWPSFTEEEAEAVKQVILSNKVNYWTGDECRQFEKEFAEFAGCKYAVALTNGTVALDLALQALGMGAGDEVIVTPRSYIASVSTVVNAGATPVFADVDLNSQNIEAHTIEPCITQKTKAIIVVHLAGMPVDMDAVMALAKAHGLYVIEDCAQAHGAVYKGKPVGSIGHIGAWSFCQDKIMTTGGEGGMVATNDKALWEKMWSYKDHGKSYDTVYNRDHPPGFRWLHESFGTNWRMMEVQAVIGRIQLKRMGEWRKRREQHALAINKILLKYDFMRLVRVPDHVEHAHYKHYAFVIPEKLPKNTSRDDIANQITDMGYVCMQGSCSEIYLEKAFDDTGFAPNQPLPNAKELGETSLMFLVHPTITDEQMQAYCCAINEVLDNLE